MKITPELCLDLVKEKIKPSMSFDENNDYFEWKKQIEEKFLEITGLNDIAKCPYPLNFDIEKEEQKDGYRQIRYTIETEMGCIIPCYILIPNNLKGKAPVCITLQGHSSGFHNSIGEPKDEHDKAYSELPNGRGAFAYQAVKQGFIAVAMEQRGMGETRPMRWNYQWASGCVAEAMRAFEVGRTVIGERVWDVSKVVDSLANFPECDLDDITITGNSGGGTTSYYAACFDKRIKYCVPSCSFCPYKPSIMQVYHCPCNYIPNALKYFDMQDLACLIAPRKLLIVSGKKDRIFPIDGVRLGYKTIEEIYKKENAIENLNKIENEEEHFWHVKNVWEGIKKIREKKIVRKTIIPELCHDTLRNNIHPALSFDENKNFDEWKIEIKNKFYELTGLNNIAKNACPLNFEVEEEKQKDGYKQIRFTINSEINCVVPCYILIPNNLKGKAPVCITLQGHSTGFHNSIGEPKDDGDKDYGSIPNGQGTFAWQAVQHGYIAVAIEQRGMGESRPMRWNHQWANMCSVTALQAFELGRTILGERMWDVSKVIDVLPNFPECDMDDISITGNSGGGTMSYYAGCFDERIKYVAPCSGFSPYKTSIMEVFHCACNYIPKALKYFEMQDLACLIAPRKLVLFQGKQERIFPIKGVREGYKTIEQIYKKANAQENCHLVEKEDGHAWGNELVWNNLENIRRGNDLNIIKNK